MALTANADKIDVSLCIDNDRNIGLTITILYIIGFVEEFCWRVPLDTIKAMQAFAAVVRHQSFTAGAQEIGLSVKVVSNHVRQLEERLEVQLLNRTTRRVSLTDTGRAYYERSIPLLAQFDELESVVQEKQSVLAGLIRITAPTAFGSAELVKALASFQALHTKVKIDLVLADHRMNIVDEGFDLAIRFGTLEDSTLMARQLMEMPLVVYASPEYIEQHGRPVHPAALATHNCLLQQASNDATHWIFFDGEEEISVRVNGSFKANSPRAVAHMAIEGIGIGMTPKYVAQSGLDSGELVLLLSDFDVSPFSLHAVYPQTRHLVARVRSLIDHLALVLGESY